MKFVLFSLVLCVTLLSCNPNNPTPNPPAPNPVQSSWTMTIDNKTYSSTEGAAWETWGIATSINSVIKLTKINLPGNNGDDVFVEFGFYPMNVGTWTITETSGQSTSTSPSSIWIDISDYPLQNNNVAHSVAGGYPVNITLNITEFSTVQGGYVKGNFNGTYTDFSNHAHTISGQFNAIRTE
jgi:hypothetical protein